MGLRRRVRRPLRASRQSWLDTGVSSHESDSERLQALCLAMYQADWLPDEAYEELRGLPLCYPVIDQAKVAEHLRLTNEARVTHRNLILERKMRELLAEVAKVAAELNAKASA
jgi:hypothetical protein